MSDDATPGTAPTAPATEPDPTPPSGGMPGWVPYAVGAVVVVGLIAGAIAAIPRLGLGGPPPEPEREPDVVLVVMDTVRADHLHLCGHDKPNTPVMDGLKAEGWQVRCDAISPAPWTVPSHVSFFTGVHYVDARQYEGDDGKTLAMQMADKGYDTLSLSANMVLRKTEVFTDGFRVTQTARNFNQLKGPRFPIALDEMLQQADPNKPLFLFLNLVDAHAPYPPIPRGVDWAKPQRGIQHRRFETGGNSPFHRYMTGQMDPEESAKYKVQLDNGYDYGIFLADQNIGAILDALKARGRMKDYRIVITSDHGELLGEHSVIGHGDTLFEPGMRVPFLYKDSSGDAVQLPEHQLNGIQAFYLLRDGKLGEIADPPYATNYQAQGPESSNGLVMWTPEGDKLVWKNGERFRFDLKNDPDEKNPLPIEGAPMLDRFEELVEKNQPVIELEDQAKDPETIQLLRAAGYVE
ncbi:MAG: sulfatase-like hydrolase/transferase [Myxococcales bacterium]|nr:sulfatase-like hydrolase/transferase [Myxococcales bacterium]